MIKKLDYKLPHLNKNQDDIVFQSPWHSQLFAMTIQLSEQGNFKWVEFVEVFGEALNNKRLKLMRLYYITRVNIPSGAAQSVQIASMCDAFNNQDIEFKLISSLNRDNGKLKKKYIWNRI